MKRVSAVAGHAIAFDVDREISAARSRADIEDMLAHAAQTVESDLDELRRNDPDVFAREVPRLTRIEFRYGDAAQPIVWQGSSLVFTRRYKRELVVSGEVAGAIRDLFHDALDRRFANVATETVTPADRADYFVYLTWRGRRRGAKNMPPEAVLDRALRLARLVGGSDPQLASRLRAWLLEQAQVVANKARPEAATPEAKSVTARWVEWSNATLPSASPAEKLVVARAVFGQSPSYGASYREVDNAIDGFDDFAFGLAIADAWRAAGHPTVRAPGDPMADLMDLVVRPPTTEYRGKLSRGDGESSAWLRHAAASEAGRRRLADSLAARNDPVFVAAVLYNVRRTDSLDATVGFLHELERHPRTWQLAISRLITEQRADGGCSDFLVEEANRVWRDVPALRGTALHIIACKHARHHAVSDEHFAQFPRLYGESVGPALFASFLDDGPDAMKLADMLWPAMTKGWSRVGAIEPRLDAFLADPAVRAGADGEPMRTLGALVARFCQDGSPAEIARFHAMLATRARADENLARALAKTLDDTEPRRCPPKR